MKKILFLIPVIFCSVYFNARIHEADKHMTTDPTVQLKDIPRQDSVRIINRRPRLGIVPGQLIGNVKINQPMESVIKFLGPPDDGDSSMGKTIAFWYTGHKKINNTLAVYAVTDPNIINGKPMVKVISVTSPSFVTEKKIHTGLSYKSISKVYALKKMNANIYSSAQGISFEFDRRKKCTTIFVHDKNFNVNTIYLSMHPES